MTKKAYKNFNLKDLTYRDILAIERTALANERTLLSYIRTMIGFIAVGGTMIKLFTEKYLIYTGLFMVILGFVILLIGVFRFIKIHMLLDSVEGGAEPPSLGKLVLHKLHLPVRH